MDELKSKHWVTQGCHTASKIDAACLFILRLDIAMCKYPLVQDSISLRTNLITASAPAVSGRQDNIFLEEDFATVAGSMAI